jgi:hypothetical protein
MTVEDCTCFWLPEKYWLSAASLGYGSGYEPGSQMEPNPECPVHFPENWEDCSARAVLCGDGAMRLVCIAHKRHIGRRGLKYEPLWS